MFRASAVCSKMLARVRGVRALSGAFFAPRLARSDYGVVEREDLAYFRAALGEQFVVTDDDALLAQNTDWTGK